MMKAPSHTLWLRRAGARYGSIVVVLILWELTTRTGIFNNFLLPPLSDVLYRFALDFISGEIPRHALATAYRAAVGFAIAAGFGILTGGLMSMSAVIRRIMEPIVSVAFPIPKISFLPIFILWFGLDDLSKVLMIAFSCVVPIISATYLGTTTVDKYFLWSARNLGTSRQALFWKVIVPAASPQIISGLQVAFPLALIIAVVTEMLTGGDGLGGYMIRSVRFAQSDKVFAGLLATLFTGLIFIQGFAMLRARLLVWHNETAVTAAG
ncbi:MAG TPA: ABC transporter permease [Pseudolabrys sp.]|nr:ABC transporter permease [Pseudolabrys sp.]